MSEGFLAGTTVQTPTGVQAIEILRPGSQVLGFDPNNWIEPVPQTVVEIRRILSRDVTPFGCGAQQKVFAKGNFLTVGEFFDPSEMLLGEPQELYIITTEPNHTFILGTGLRVHNGGGGSGSAGTTYINSTTNQNSNRDPYAPLQPYLIDLWSKAKGANESQDRSPYTDAIYAGPVKQQRRANQLLGDLGEQLVNTSGLAEFLRTGALNSGSGGGMAVGSPGYEEAVRLAIDQLNGKYVDVNANPYLQSYIEMMQRKSNEAYQQGVVPYIGSAAQQAGAYGGSRHGIVEGQAAAGQSQALADIATNVGMQNYQFERGIQQTSPDILSKAQQWKLNEAQNSRANASAAAGARSRALNDMLQSIELIGQAGEQKQAWQQGAMDARLKLALMNRDLTDPYRGLDVLSQAYGLGTPYGSTTGVQETKGTQKAPQPSSGASFLSSLLGIGSTAAGIASLLGWNPLGAAATVGGGSGLNPSFDWSKFSF